MADRQQLLQEWLKQVLGTNEFDMTAASNDASFRRYFRATLKDRSYVAMDAPPDKEDCGPFIKIATAMHEVGLHVPEIHAEDHERGFLLLDDLGTRSYLDELNQHTVDNLYADAIESLLILQGSDILDNIDLPLYDETLLMQEMDIFREWYLGTHLGVELSKQQQADLQRVFEVLTSSALEQPTVCVHRDYHSRNLMVVDEDNPGIIDFQDAVIGPVTYDLVSLLRDCYIEWPQVLVESWAVQFCDELIEIGVLGKEARQSFMRWFDLMGVQRHLKASGIFARLNHRDGKPGYLDDIPRTLGYVKNIARRYDELASLTRLLDELN